MAQIKKVILKIYNGKRFVSKYELAKLLHNIFPTLFFGPTYLCDNNTYYALAYAFINLCLIDKKPFLTKEKDDKIIYHFLIP